MDFREKCLKFVLSCLNLTLMARKKQTLEYQLDHELSLLIQEPSFNFPGTGTSKQVGFGPFLTDKMMVMAAIQAGIPYSLFNLIQQFSPFSEIEWAEYLNISTKSLQRYKTSGGFSFKPIHSEKILEIAEVTRAGVDVFGSQEKFKLWLNTPNFSLGNKLPLHLLKDSYGKELVLSELTRINYGLLA